MNFIEIIVEFLLPLLLLHIVAEIVRFILVTFNAAMKEDDDDIALGNFRI